MTVDDQKEFDQRLTTFKDDLRRRHLAEERRLAYVAFTRAKDALLLSGSFWSSTVKPRQPSRYLAELVEAGLVPAEAVPAEPDDESDPLAQSSRELVWPVDPLGPRRARVELAAVRVERTLRARESTQPVVEAALEGGDATPDATPLTTGDAATRRDGDAGPWADDIDLLLLEREAIRRQAGSIDLPQRIPASRFKDYVADPSGVASALRRPLPERPYRATRLGTLFHEWVEQRYRPTGRAEMLDAWGHELDLDDGQERGGNGLVDPDDARRLGELQATFERSPWARLHPVDVELEVHLPLGRRTVICKIDAVFEREGRLQVVDWKTGRAPSDDADLELRQLQLALYREAYSAFRGVPATDIDAAFYFVADDVVVEPRHIASRAELAALWEQVEAGG